MLQRRAASTAEETRQDLQRLKWRVTTSTTTKKLQNAAVIAELWSPGLSHISGLLISNPDFVYGNWILITLVFHKFSNNFIKRKADAHVEYIHILPHIYMGVCAKSCILGRKANHAGLRNGAVSGEKHNRHWPQCIKTG